MTRERRDDQLTIRVPRRIREAIDAQADRERRTSADVVNNILEAHYASSTRDGSRRR